MCSEPDDLERGLDDGRRDALALIAGRLAGDDDGVLAVWHGASNHVMILAAACGLLVDLLDDHGVDPATWVAGKQAELLAREAAGLSCWWCVS